MEQTMASDNADVGLHADQGGAGAGTLQLMEVTTLENGDGALVVNAGVTVIQTP
jgi:hypothetical protein